MNTENYKCYKMNRIIRFLILAFALVSSSDNLDAQRYYFPNEGDMLMLADKGDIKLSSVFPGEGLYTTQIGYSPVKYLSVSGTFLSSRFDSGIDSNPFGFSQTSYKGHNFTGSVGGYYMIKMKNTAPTKLFISRNVTLEQGFLFDLYAGYSFGEVHNTYSKDPNIYSRFKTGRTHIQAGVHWTFRLGTISYTFRYINLDFKKGKVEGELNEPQLFDIFDGIQANDPFNFTESSFRYQIGIRQVRIYTGMTFRKARENMVPLDERQVIVTAGLVFELDEIFGKKNVAEQVPDDEGIND